MSPILVAVVLVAVVAVAVVAAAVFVGSVVIACVLVGSRKEEDFNNQLLEATRSETGGRQEAYSSTTPTETREGQG